MSHVARNGTSAYIGLPEREAVKLQDLWLRDEIGIELSVEVRAPVVVGVYPMRIATYLIDHGTNANGHALANGSSYGLHPRTVPTDPLDTPAPTIPADRHAEPGRA